MEMLLIEQLLTIWSLLLLHLEVMLLLHKNLLLNLMLLSL
jgi:hypothetical protein